MDGQRFDDLTRSLIIGISRRGVLRTVLGGSLGGTLALLGFSGEATAADCGSDTCDPDCETCQNVLGFINMCVPIHAEDEEPSCTDDGNPCTRNRCQRDHVVLENRDRSSCKPINEDDLTACPTGSCCDGACIDLQSDEGHCGGCGTTCGDPASPTCSNGICCAAGRTGCLTPNGEICVNTKRNRKHCGRCNRRCRNGKVCRKGKCLARD